MRSRSRGRPKKILEMGPTPELIQKRQNHFCQWQVSIPQCFSQGWWHLFYHRLDITHQQFMLSQDFALFRHWSHKFNTQHPKWQSPLALPSTVSSITFSDTEQDLISRWWHTLLRETELTPLWKLINFLYDTTPPNTYQKTSYEKLLQYTRFCLIKLATHWVSRQDFIELYANVTRSNLQTSGGQSNQYVHQSGDKRH